MLNSFGQFEFALTDATRQGQLRGFTIPGSEYESQSELLNDLTQATTNGA